MAVVFTVAGSTVVPLAGTFSLEETYGSRTTCSFSWLDLGDLGVHPALGDAVTVVDGATTIFSGIVSIITEEGFSPRSSADLRRGITATDYTAVCDQLIVTETYATGTHLDAILADLVTTYLHTPFGIHLDGAQAEGPALEELSYENKTLTEVFADLQSRTGWIFQISYAKILGMYEITGALASPFSLTATSYNFENIKWELTKENYFNRLYVIYGPTGIRDLSDYWTATAGQTAFPLHYTDITGYRVVIEDSIYWPVGVYGVDVMRWTYDAANNILYRAAAPPIGAGIAVEFSISAYFPQTTYDEILPDHTNNPWESTIEAPDCVDYISAKAIATAKLTEFGVDAKRVRFDTYTYGLHVGQILTITLPTRHLSGTHLITSINASHINPSPSQIKYEVECVSGDYAQGMFTDTYRNWSGSSSSSGSITGGGIISTGSTVLHAHLGGSRTEFFNYHNDTDFTPIIGYQVFKCKTGGAYTFRHETKTDQDGLVEVQIRLWDLTSSAVVAGSTSTAHHEATWQEVESSVTLVAGHKYRVEINGSNDTYGIYCGQATLEL